MDSTLPYSAFCLTCVCDNNSKTLLNEPCVSVFTDSV